MNDIKTFKNPQFGEIRMVMQDGEPWFVGKDMASALGYVNTKDALAKHVDDEDKRGARIATPSRGMQNVSLINESGMYSLILSSKLPSAKVFKQWVTREVLPAIRKTGVYNLRPPLTGYCASLRARRKTLGLTQKQLADLCGVSRSHLANWESSIIPNRDNMAMLERVLQLEEERQAKEIADAIQEGNVMEIMGNAPKCENEDKEDNATTIDYALIAKVDALCQGILKDLQAFQCQSTGEIKARLSLITKMGALIKLF